MQYRKDIGCQALGAKPGLRHTQALELISTPATARSSLMSQAVRSTYTPKVLAGIGSFGGLFDARVLQGLPHPVLVASTDGVGTKVKLAAQTGRYHGPSGRISSITASTTSSCRAPALIFPGLFCHLGGLSPEVVAEIVGGIAAACRAAGCALLGGETAEMPGVYAPGEFDVAGTIVGLVEREQHLTQRQDLRAGDVLVGLRSSGPHTNGYSLIRRVFDGVPWTPFIPNWAFPWRMRSSRRTAPTCRCCARCWST